MTNKDLIGTFSFETGGYSYEDGQAIAELLDEYGRAKKPVRKPTKKPTKKPSKKPTKKPTKKPKTVKPKTTTTTTTSTTTRTTTPEPTTTEILTTSFTTTSTTVATKKVSFSDQFAFLAAGNSQNANGAFGLFGNSKEEQEQERGKKNKNKKSNKNQVVGSYDNYQNYFQAQLKNEEDFSCWTCSRSYWEKDSTGDMYADCRTHGEMITCPKQKEDLGSDHFSSANSCQVTERRFFGIVTELHVGCKQTRACQANFNQNKMNGR
ncbi:unnamed protein product [Oikopleura dioica]|uniref:Uncharacterized protein n=1 Tax=Oikopleura dioica TaxID=34765 RepID=E4YEX3_OIKDI|nr:unnamed protein product [Oikopleura dioica]